MTLRALLAAAEEAGVTFAAEEKRLGVEFTSGTDPALLAALRERKGEILGWLTRDKRGWLRLESRLLGETILLPFDEQAPLPEEYAGLACYPLTEAARFLGNPEDLVRFHRERGAAAAAGLLAGAPLRAVVCHIFAGVALESQPDAAGP